MNEKNKNILVLFYSRDEPEYVLYPPLTYLPWQLYSFMISEHTICGRDMVLIVPCLFFNAALHSGGQVTCWQKHTMKKFHFFPVQQKGADVVFSIQGLFSVFVPQLEASQLQMLVCLFLLVPLHFSDVLYFLSHCFTLSFSPPFLCHVYHFSSLLAPHMYLITFPILLSF